MATNPDSTLSRSNKYWVPHISLVFREMWDTADVIAQLPAGQSEFEGCQEMAAVSHISRKTSEIWGTQYFVAGTASHLYLPRTDFRDFACI